MLVVSANNRTFILKRTNWVLYIVVVATMCFSVGRYSLGIWRTLGFRFGWLDPADLPLQLQVWLPQISPLQDALYVSGYVLMLTAFLLVLGRNVHALWFYLAGGGIARIDWALLPASPNFAGDLLGITAFIQFFALLTLLLLLGRRGFLVRDRLIGWTAAPGHSQTAIPRHS